MTIDGHGKRDIAMALTADKVLISAACAAEMSRKLPQTQKFHANFIVNESSLLYN